MQSSAFIAIVGRPNVGKSSLLNAIIGEKIAIVTDKPQTTRTKITGILTDKDVQLVFIDTPGLHKPKNKLSEYMVKQINDSIGDVDFVILVTEPTDEIYKAELKIIEDLKRTKLPAIVLINKIDTVTNKDGMMKKMLALSNAYDFQAIIPISVLNNDGIDVVMDYAKKQAVEGPHHFPSDSLTDQSERILVGEMIREKILMHMRDEIPHGIAVGVEKMKERSDKDMLDIDAIIYCERETHKGMVIGKKGEMLKQIASQARMDMESFFQIKVNLQCWVKVREDWRSKEGSIKHLGYK